jgi:hypothetical protein
MRTDASRRWEAIPGYLPARANARRWRSGRFWKNVLPPIRPAIYRRLYFSAICLIEIWFVARSESFLSALGKIAYLLVCALVGVFLGFLIAWLREVGQSRGRRLRNQSRVVEAAFRPHLCSLASHRPLVPAHLALANQRANALLLENLTDQQRRQYAAHGHFDVIGGDTGRHGSAQNIEELDALGHRVCIWCFYPVGVVVGDVLLAQKTALESFESEALRIANSFPLFAQEPDSVLAEFAPARS